MIPKMHHRPIGKTGCATAALILMTACVLCGPAPAAEGLVAHYTFDEGPGAVVKDSSGNDNHGEIFDDVQYVKDGQGKGYSLHFNSGKAYVDCGKKPSLDITDAITLALWFRPETTVQQGEGGVIGKVMGSYCMSYSGKCWFYAPAGSNFTSTKPLSLAWHHIVATFDGQNIKMYVDGKLQGAIKSKVTTLPSGENFYLRYPATYLTVTPEYKCTMDDVRVYNRALSARAIYGLYKQEAKASGRHDVTGLEQVKLTSHTFPQSATVVMEADYARMGAMPLGAALKLEVANAADGKVVATHETLLDSGSDSKDGKEPAIRLEFQDHKQKGVSYWTLNVKNLPAGNYQVRAVIKDKGGGRIGEPSSIALDLPLVKPDWIKAYNNTKVLNNFAAELLNVESVQTEAQKEYSFNNPRDGWVFISTTAETQGADKVLVSVDAEPEPVIVHAKGKERTLEAMRRLPAGPHKLHIRCEGAARPNDLVVRAIPAMMVAGLGYSCGAGWPNVPILPCFGRYNMEYLEKIGILDNTNTLTEKNPVPENAAYARAWRDQGKKIIVPYMMWEIWQNRPDANGIFKMWTESRGLAGADYDGIMGDEFSGSGHGGVGNYPLYAEAVKRIAEDPRFKGKVFYPACMPMYTSDLSMDFLKAVVTPGYKWCEEKYLTEQPTEPAADAYMDLRLRENLLRYNRTFPGAARHMITILGFLSAPPETLNVNPAVNFKVHMDKQMHFLANNPVFFGLYGIWWYHNGYADEEDLRWSAKLFRHYCIEGKKERLTDDPYILSHIENPDFDEGAAGWTLQAAEQGGIAIEHAAGLGVLQTRVRAGDDNAGNNFLLTTRTAAAPNRFSQTIKGLTPGRQYSLKMFTADYDEMKKGTSAQDQKHHLSIRIDGVELAHDKAFHQLFPSSLAGHVYGPFTRENPLYVTYHRVVFRAKTAAAELTISDWQNNDEPGGPIGQRLTHNFIEVQPYLEE